MNYDELKAECAKYGHALLADLPHNCLYWCCHHEVLCEKVGNPYERIKYIVMAKPEKERARRLAEFVPVKAQATATELLADYEAKCAPLWADYAAKCDAPPLAQLHRDECPDTKWNGRTIFPEAT